MGIKIFTWRKRARNSKRKLLPISGVSRDCVRCTLSNAWEKEAFTSYSADYNGFNIHARKATKTALLEAERKKDEALMKWQQRHFF